MTDRAALAAELTTLRAEAHELSSAIQALEARSQLRAQYEAGSPMSLHVEIGELVLAVQRQLDDLEREHSDARDELRAATEVEASRILRQAQADAAAMSTVVTQLRVHEDAAQ